MSMFEDFAGESLAPFLADATGEPITLTPAGGAPVNLSAQINRDPLSPQPMAGGSVPTHHFTMLVERAVYPGIVNVNGDNVTFPARLGDTQTVTMRVTKILASAGGMWNLRLE